MKVWENWIIFLFIRICFSSFQTLTVLVSFSFLSSGYFFHENDKPETELFPNWTLHWITLFFTDWIFRRMLFPSSVLSNQLGMDHTYRARRIVNMTACKCSDWGQIFRTLCLPLWILFTLERSGLKTNFTVSGHPYATSSGKNVSQVTQMPCNCCYSCFQPCFQPWEQRLSSSCVHHHTSGSSWCSSWVAEHCHWELLGYPPDQKTIQRATSMHSDHQFVPLRCHWARNTAKF